MSRLSHIKTSIYRTIAFKSSENIKVRVVKPNDYEEVSQFVVKHFFNDEPLYRCEPKISAGAYDQKDLLENLQYNCSLMAVQETAKGEVLVAASIGLPKEPSSIDNYFKVAEEIGVNTKLGRMWHILGVVGRQADVFNRYGVDRLFYCFMNCVKPSERGKNLSARLKVEQLALAKSLGYKLITSDCTSFYAAAYFERLGWDKVNFMAYKDYVDENNKQIFNPPAPHVGVTTFAKRL